MMWHMARGKGVAVFALDFRYQRDWRCFMGPYEIRGWPNGLYSLKFDPEPRGQRRRMVIWSPDDGESFPTAFGRDGKLFTADDPVGPIQKGWTVVDLETRTFHQNQNQTG